ncbi:hypothetical protein BDQ94DRAFT_164259 [Aspergillus welwitschiae]|uniref:Uncharacterized protein n=1 Tax=Aspergillus welwitschiae TaxID=1341132 RepID=A0A3F3PIC7_9EURO|nr:hypothetical protein BDQ94DRAFT_164259 [Aspergillus welwitschiae]RDH26704.1 hypothetical protein BDQ94DRAFT_164259 [Aspergillus welwitschiae]
MARSVSQCSPPMASITRATGRHWSPLDVHPLTREAPHYSGPQAIAWNELAAKCIGEPNPQ